MKNQNLVYGFLVVAGISLVQPVHAELVQMDFSGTTQPGSAFGVSPLFGTLTFDSVSYTADILEGWVSVGGNTWSYTPKPPNISNLQSIYVYNNVGQPAFDAVTFYVGITGQNVMYGSDIWRPSYMVLSFGNETNILSSFSIPTDVGQLNLFSSRYANLQFERLDENGNGTGAYSGMAFAPIAVGLPVPEADTYAMMAVGLGLVGFMARRRKLARHD